MSLCHPRWNLKVKFTGVADQLTFIDLYPRYVIQLLYHWRTVSMKVRIGEPLNDSETCHKDTFFNIKSAKVQSLT